MTQDLTRRQVLLLLLLVVVLLGTRPTYAMPASCYVDYAQFVTTSWNTYESCVQETNAHEWYVRLGTRQLCRLEWASNAFQAEGAYASCMSGFSGLWK